MMQTVYQQQAKRKLIAGLVSLIVVAGVVVYADHIKSDPAGAKPSNKTVVSAPSANSTTSPAPAASSSQPTSSSGIKDGSYSAELDYFVPHGDESLKVN